MNRENTEDSVTEDSVIEWLAEVDQKQLEEDRRTHVLFNEDCIETDHVLEAEMSDHEMTIKKLGSQWAFEPTQIRKQ